jgi:hypothetical protein
VKDLSFFLVPALAMTVVVVLWMWYKNPFNLLWCRWTGDRCLVRFLENYGKNFVVIDAFLVSLKTDIIKRNDRAYILDMQRAIMDRHGRGYLYYDIDSALPLAPEIQAEREPRAIDPQERVIKRTPSGHPVLTVKEDERGQPLLWFDPSYVDAGLFHVRLQTAVWAQILSGVFQKYALYIIIGLIVGIVAVIVVAFWQTQQLTQQVIELSKKLAELAATGGVVGG